MSYCQSLHQHFKHEIYFAAHRAKKKGSGRVTNGHEHLFGIRHYWLHNADESDDTDNSRRLTVVLSKPRDQTTQQGWLARLIHSQVHMVGVAAGKGQCHLH